MHVFLANRLQLEGLESAIEALEACDDWQLLSCHLFLSSLLDHENCPTMTVIEMTRTHTFVFKRVIY